MGQETRNVHKIHHSFACDDTGSIYIATNLSVEEVADLIIGLEFYIETHSKYGERSCITEEMAGYFLCEFYGAILVSRERLSTFFGVKELPEGLAFRIFCYVN